MMRLCLWVGRDGGEMDRSVVWGEKKDLLEWDRLKVKINVFTLMHG
jgi:hypothetical protein